MGFGIHGCGSGCLPWSRSYPDWFSPLFHTSCGPHCAELLSPLGRTEARRGNGLFIAINTPSLCHGSTLGIHKPASSGGGGSEELQRTSTFGELTCSCGHSSGIKIAWWLFWFQHEIPLTGSQLISFAHLPARELRRSFPSFHTLHDLNPLSEQIPHGILTKGCSKSYWKSLVL